MKRLLSFAARVLCTTGVLVLTACSSDSDVNVSIPASRSEYVVFAWNDLGMHCMNRDFSELMVLPPFNVLHVCKRRNLLLECADYPVAAFSWDATDPLNPTLADGLAGLPGAVMGGISYDETLVRASSDEVVAEYRRALEMTRGRRWLAAPGCSIPPATPAAHLRAVRDAVASTPLPPERVT